MAIYHLSVKAISRSTGRSATAAAAYRAAERVIDERTGEVFDFTRKAGVEHAQIIMPAGATWSPGRAELWNAAEAAERRKDACVAREHECALPRELDAAERLALVRSYSQDLADRHGCAVDFAIHQPRSDAEAGKENWHAHILMTTRQVFADGLGQKCDREKAGRDRKADLQAERLHWAEFVNAALADADLAARVDHRSLVDQRAAAEAKGKHDEARQPSRHRGPVEDGMRRRGRRSRRAADQVQAQGDTRQAAWEAREAERVARLAATELRSLKRKQRITRPPNRIGGERRPSVTVDFLTKQECRGRTVYFWPNGSAAVIDRGDSLSVPRATDARIQAAVAIATAKGWTSLTLTGSDDFKRRATAEAFRAGLTIRNPEMQEYMQELAAAREQAEAATRAERLPAEAWELGQAARRIDQQIREQETARARAARPELDEEEKRARRTAKDAKENMMDDYTETDLQEIFAADLTSGIYREATEQEAAAAAAEQKLSFFSRGTVLQRLKNRKEIGIYKAAAEAARGKARGLREHAEKLEKAAREMKHPKIVAHFQKWLKQREERQATALREADARLAEVQEQKRKAGEKAGLSPEQMKQATDDLAQVQAKADQLPPGEKAEFKAALAGADRRRWEEEQQQQAERERRRAQLQQQPKSKSTSKGMKL